MRYHDRTERWKAIEGYPSYAVSTAGNIKRIAPYRKEAFGDLLRFSRDTRGYFVVKLYRDGLSKTIAVHRLVAKAFMLPVPNGKQVNHKDGNRNNNSLDNLEWVTPSENAIHATKMGLWKQNKKKPVDADICEED